MELTKPFLRFFDELKKKRYKTWSIYDYFFSGRDHSRDRVDVLLRIDVDTCFHLCPRIAEELDKRNLKGSFFFLTFPERYYSLWNSSIPKKISDMGFEVGLHSDHYYEQLISNIDAIERIKEDVKRLSDLIGKPIHGMVYHGHNEIDKLGKWNGEVYMDIEPELLGLSYHDGKKSLYSKFIDKNWRPNTDYYLSDYITFRGWGTYYWRYYPSYPIKILRRTQKGKSIHVCLHPQDMFNWWKKWDYSFNEKKPNRPNLFTSMTNFIGTRMILQVKPIIDRFRKK